MTKGKLLLKNTAIVTIGKVCTQLIAFFLLPLYTAVLTQEEYGIVDLLNTLISLFLPILTLQIEQGIFRFLIDAREDKEKQKKIISTTIIFLCIQTLIYIIIFMLSSIFIHNEYKYFLATNLIVTTFSSILLQAARGLGDNTRYSIGSFITGASTVILNVCFIVAFGLGAYGMLTASFIGNLLCVIYILLSKKIYRLISRKYFDKTELKKILKYSIPLIPNIISWWIVNASDRGLITYFLGIAQNGIYSAANKFSNVFTTLYSVFNLTWTESTSVNINTKDRDEFFSKILDLVIRIFGALAILIIAVIPFAFSILINEKFEESYYQIPILMIASFISVLVSFMGSIYVAKKQTKEIAKTSIFSAILNIIINVLLINKIGLYAASISTLISYFAMLIYRLIDSRKYVKLKVDYKLILSMIVIGSCSIIGYYINSIYINIAVAVLAIIYAILINKNYLKKSVIFIVKKLGI